MTTSRYIEPHAPIIERCKHGDRKAQYELYKLYAKAMYNVCCRILTHTAEAEDVLQEAFVDAFARLHSYRQEAAFGAWLKRLVVNKAINQLRQRRIRFDDIEQHTATADTAALVDYFIEEGQETLDVKTILQAVEQLPDGYRVVVTLYLFEGYDHEEIAQILGISEVTSRSQLSRGKAKLASILNQ